MISSKDIRQHFLDFFESKGHKIVPSAPIVNKNDPTLMFTNAGMNPFKDYFLGNLVAKDTKVADTQKCLRVSGKHNDLEEVGIDTYHHTMFEMLGNWSFGDYFKQEAISWAWELLTEVYKLPKERLYVTVFEGDAKEGLDRDTDSEQIWSSKINPFNILDGNKKDNFWEMGEQGPCGPCSEIHIDLREENEIKALGGKELVNTGHPQVIEIWNIVFIQYNRKADGSLESLPQKHVDTGMGFERLVRVIQGKKSNYDTDIFMPLINALENHFNHSYGKNEQTDIAFRVIVDHIRAVAFCIADGQMPSNTGAGYVIRRILRRAIRYGYTYLGMDSPSIYLLVELLANQFQTVFPELEAQKDFVAKVIREEEASFLRTLSAGIKRFEQFVSENPSKTLSGAFTFELFDTYGFPYDLTNLMAQERGLSIDEATFNELLTEQKNRSRNEAQKETSDWVLVAQENITPQFVGYDSLHAETKIIKYRNITHKGKNLLQVVLHPTPFYPEGGGQVGDSGIISNANESIKILNTFKENELILSEIEKLPISVSSVFFAQVDTDKRKDTERNHSATHLLHEALRDILGTHVAQKGSLVNNEYLRFDFSHFQKMSDEEIEMVEKQINEKIRDNYSLQEFRSIPIKEATDKGAMALFGEKYGETVRMIQFGDSKELCGGTHVMATGNIGFFKLISEGAIASGIRRIEALTGKKALEWVLNQEQQLKEVKQLLKTPKSISQAIESLQEENKKLQSELVQLQTELINGKVQGLSLAVGTLPNGTALLLKQLDISAQEDNKLWIQAIKNKFPDAVLVLGQSLPDKANIWVSLPGPFAKQYNISAGEIIKAVAPTIGGGGGGQPLFAMAGGKNPNKLTEAIEQAHLLILEKIK